jgi:hypothetical protein
MEDVRIIPQGDPPTGALRAQRLTAGLVAQYIHELSDRHAAGRRAARSDRAPVTEPGGD